MSNIPPRGIQLAAQAGAVEHAAVLEAFKDQFIIVLLKELQARGHDLCFPVVQLDDTGHDMVSFRMLPGPDPILVFELSKKA